MANVSEFAIADTCFLIDWALWRRRDSLFKVFRVVFVPESVLNEIKGEETISWVASWFAREGLALLTETSDVLNEARELVSESRRLRVGRGVDLPEAICIVFGRLMGYTVLTENRGALIAVDLIEKYSGVRVWRSLEVIKEACKRGLFGASDPGEVFKEYELDTKHRFPRRDLDEALREIRGED